MNDATKVVEYHEWHTPNAGDAGAVHRAVVQAASELAMADEWARKHGPENELAKSQAQHARLLAFFTVGRVADHDVCDLDRALDFARNEDRRVGTTPEQRYAEAILGYIGGEL
jgi:SH3-like domain-containing protein